MENNGNLVDEKIINEIASLAKIQIRPEHVAGIVQDLTAILHLVKQMESVDTDNISPMAHPQDLIQREREDLVSEPDQHQYFQQIAPLVEDDVYLVPSPKVTE